MTISKSRKDFVITALMGIATGLVGDAVWDGIKKIATGINLPHINTGAVFQLLAFIAVGMVGAFLGKTICPDIRTT
jgi:hypothetical protein